jgi:hypothetical protein
MVSSSWKIDSSSKTSGSDDFLRVKSDSNLTVRLLGRPVRAVKIFTHDRKCIILDNEEIGQHLKAKFPDLVGNISIRYACWCIDRDSGALKILDMPQSVARAFGTRAKLIGCNISGAVEGCDWKIITNGKSGKDVRYEAVYIEETPLTEAEKQKVESRKSEEGRYFDLTKIFKSYSFKEAEEQLLK